MNHFSQLLAKFQKDESGQDIVEYALLGALMALSAVSSLRTVATGVAGIFTTAGTTISPSI